MMVFFHREDAKTQNNIFRISSLNSRHIPYILTALLALSLFGMVLDKAATASFTHDESFTCNHYVTAPLADIFSYKVVSPNNHLLNTLLMKAFSTVAGSSAFVLRLPNVLAFIGFMIFILLLLRRMNSWLALSLFALACCNPYMLDFFALARGNGLSLGFMAGSIYFFRQHTESRSVADYVWTALFAVLAVLSHFTLLYYLLSVMIVANLTPLLERYLSDRPAGAGWKPFFMLNLVNLAAVLVLGLILWGPIARLTAGDQFFYGGETGFIKDTVGTLVETFFYGSPLLPHLAAISGILVVVVALSGVCLLVYAIVARDRAWVENNKLLSIFLLLLIFMVAINLSQFYLTGTKLLIRRYALLYAPVFMLVTGLLLLVRRKGRLIPALAVPAGLLALAMTVHTLALFSRSTYLDWDYEKETARVTGLLEREIPAGTPKESVTLGTTWLFEPTINFYRATRGMKWLKPVTREGPGIAASWYYVVHDDILKIPLRRAKPVILFDDGKTVLVRLQRQ